MSKVVSDKGSFKILFHYLKHDKFKIFLYVFLSILTYVPDVLSVLIVGVALEALLLKDFSLFVLYLASYEGIYIFTSCIVQLPKDYLHNYLEIKFIKNVSKDIYIKYQDMPAIAFEEMGVGELVNRLYSDPDRILELLARLIRLICKAIVVLVVVVISFSVSIYVGLEIVIFALIMGFISYKFFPKIKQTQREIKSESDKFMKNTTENISGIREIKSLGIKRNMQNIVDEKIDKLSSANFKIRNYEVTYYSINSFIYFVLQFIILLTCGYLFVKGHIVYSVFMMIEMYMWRIDEVVSSISEFGVSYNKIKVSLGRISEIINNKLYLDENYGNVNLTDVKGTVEFKNVEFKYREEEELTLKGLNLKFEPHKKIAVVGRSGNGKSTIFNLLLRFFDTAKGQILIDGYDIKSLNEKSLRKAISAIRQNPFLFNLSILDNFKIVKPNATLKEIREVCQKAYIDEYIMSLPDKYNTIIGEGGINLSGGQKQRIAIARTLLRDTKIILFDEATSALDNESQEYIKKTIDNLVQDHTIIVVAHRLSTIIDADEIYVIDKGKLAASGTHKKLLKESKIYKSLYQNEDLRV